METDHNVEEGAGSAVHKLSALLKKRLKCKANSKHANDTNPAFRENPACFQSSVAYRRGSIFALTVMDGENHGKLVDELCQKFNVAQLDALVKRALNRPLEYYAIGDDQPSLVDKFVSELERRPVELEKFLARLRSLEKESRYDGDSITEWLLHAPRSLAEHLRVAHFRALIAERTSNFVGREFIFKEISRLLTDVTFSSGYIMIRGEPGIGKTSVIAELVRRHGYVHHFNDRRGNIRSHRHFLGSVCAQLILRHKLEHRVIPSGALEDSGFLMQLIVEAKAKNTSPSIVVLLDALDESEDYLPTSGANRLFLPSVLPAGVFFVVTTREGPDDGLSVDQRRTIQIEETNPSNLTDLRNFAEQFLSENNERMALRLASLKLDKEAFKSCIVEKSEGNFMYLKLVLHAILEGEAFVGDANPLGSLPNGLRAYYHYHWRVMKSRGDASLQAYHEPVICLLASAFEPVPITELLFWANKRWPQLDSARVREVIRQWREFLNEEIKPDRELVYRIYHSSFQDFLSEEVGLKPFHSEIANAIHRKLNSED